MTGASTTSVDDQFRPAPPEVEAVNAETSAILKARADLAGAYPVTATAVAINEVEDWIERWGAHMARHDPEELQLTRAVLGGLKLVQARAEALALQLAPAKAARDADTAAELARHEAEQVA